MYEVSILSQFMQDPRRVHSEGVLWVLVNIKQSPRRGLIYQWHGHLCIDAYSDVGMQVTREIVYLLPAIAHILEVTSSAGNRGNKRWYHALAQSMSIELWLGLCGRLYGFDHFSKILTSLLPLQCPSIVIIKPLSSSVTIPLFMSVRTTLRLIVTTFGNRLCPELSPMLMWHHLSSL